MNTTNITQFRIPSGTDLWHKFRTLGLTEEEAATIGCKPYGGGIGASEIGGILGLAKNYRPCPQETYHYKVGSIAPTPRANRAMIRGKILEPIVKDIWTLYNGDGDESWVSAIEEYQNGDRATKDMLSVRKAKKTNAYFVNDDFPWLFSSLDYFAEKGSIGLLPDTNGLPRVHKDGFPVEIKTINKNYASQWLEGVPPYHVCQLNQEMICTNSDYGEIAVLFPDDFSFRVYPFNRDEELCERIIKWSKVFWDKVVIGREAKKKMDLFYANAQVDNGDEMKSIIESNEPEPDDGEAYYDYMKERYQEGYEKSVEGDMTTYFESLSYQLCNSIINSLKEKQQGYKNNFIKILGMGGFNQIDFEAQGKITYFENKNGNRTMLVKTKPLISLDKRSEEEFNKLNLEVK